MNTFNPQLSTLRDAFVGVAGQVAQSTPRDVHTTNGERLRALANWDSSYPDEQTNYYEEFIHRHAPINIGWLKIPGSSYEGSGSSNEATGVGVFYNSTGDAEHVVAPLDDGSICLWDVRTRETDDHGRRGRLLARSHTGSLFSDGKKDHEIAKIKAMMTETGAVESVSINSLHRRGYFAYNDVLTEVDLVTLQTISQERFPFPVTALSQAPQSSLVVGTNWTVHLHDPRNKSKSTVDPSLRCEVIGGPTASHVTLSQPGPLSILDRTEDDSIWVAGRFTHLLNYDRRFFPRLRGTVHSGARISCIATLPHPYIPRTLDLLQDPALSTNELYTAKSALGTTMLAAGEYKGKGSLELYNLSSNPSCLATHNYMNRQTASSTKLLSVSTHGCSIVFSDGDGNLKWVERDGSTPIRSHNINEVLDPPTFNQAQSAAQDPDIEHGDIVQKILPLHPSQGSSSTSKRSRADVNQSDLLLKTGDGRIGILGFGDESLYAGEEIEVIVESVETRARKDAEKQYQQTLRRALQRQADEVRFVRGLGKVFNVP